MLERDVNHMLGHKPYLQFALPDDIAREEIVRSVIALLSGRLAIVRVSLRTIP